MKKSIFIVLAALSVTFPVSVSASETRCGWYYKHDGTSQTLLSLTDSQYRWHIKGHRSGFQAEGQNNLPSFAGKEYIKRQWSGGLSIYACVCLEVETDKSRKFITMIYGGEVLPLSTCDKDTNLPEKPY